MRHPLGATAICLALVLLVSGGCPWGFFSEGVFDDNDFFDGGYFPAPLLGPSVVGCGPGIGVYGCGDVFFPDFGYYDDPVFGDWSWGYGDWGWGYGDFYGGFPGVW